MCGICGIINFDGSTVSEKVLGRMNDTLAHRGPDGKDLWISPDGSCGFGHRRLAIIDRSEDGAQPMHYLERYTITYNGEIYNYKELREQLLKKGYKFKSATDTEVILALYDLKKEDCLKELDGMFSFAIWDEKEKQLFCARDRFGEKPFFFHISKNNQLLFASEIKALPAAGITTEVDTDMLANYLVYQYVTDPVDPGRTFYKGIRRLPQAHYMIYRAGGQPKIFRYWELSPDHQSDIPEKEATEKFRHMLEESVRLRLRSDVPVGSCLSGGIDSSVLVSIIRKLKKESQADQKTFSVIYPGFELNEEAHIRLLEKEKNLDAFYINPGDNYLAENIDRIFYHQEEPFPTSTIVSQFAVMQLASENGVTVLLDGQGADEVLGGYDWYRRIFLMELYRNQNKKYRPEAKAASFKKDISFVLNARFPSLYRRLSVNNQEKHFSRATKQKFEQWLLRKNPELKVVDIDFLWDHRQKLHIIPPYPPDLNTTLFRDTTEYYLPSLLRYADRNSMAFSREVRLPYLDHKLVEFAFSLPSTLKFKNAQGKFILRNAFRGMVPDSILDRKDKIGFGSPEAKWLNTIPKDSILSTSDMKGIASKQFLNSEKSSWQMLMTSKLLSSSITPKHSFK